MNPTTHLIRMAKAKVQGNPPLRAALVAHMQTRQHHLSDYFAERRTPDTAKVWRLYQWIADQEGVTIWKPWEKRPPTQPTRQPTRQPTSKPQSLQAKLAALRKD